MKVVKPSTSELVWRVCAGGVLVWCSLAPGSLAQSQDKGLPGVLGRLAAPERQAPLFQTFFPHPTGTNGLEEYAKAADLLSNSLYGDLMSWEAYRSYVLAGGRIDPEESARLQARIGDFRKTSVLDARRKVIHTMPEVRELIRRGNAKAALPLIQKNPELPDFRLHAAFKSLAKFLQIDAYVAFADGLSASGTDALAVGIEQAHHWPQDSLVARLVSIAVNSILLAATEANLDRLSSKDVDRLLKVAQACLRQAPSFVDALKADFRIGNQLSAELRKVRSAGDMASIPRALDLPEEAAGLFHGLSQSQWLAFVDRADNAISVRQQDFLAVVSRSEGTWFDELKALHWDEEPSGVPKSLEEVARRYAVTMTSVLKQATTAEAKYRTQIRLLRLHMKVLQYKWNEGRLPARLEDAASAEEIADPFGKGEFAYQPDPFGHYQLFSKGIEGLGRVDLRYRKDRNSQIDPGDLPPR